MLSTDKNMPVFATRLATSLQPPEDRVLAAYLCVREKSQSPDTIMRLFFIHDRGCSRSAKKDDQIFGPFTKALILDIEFHFAY